MSKPVGAANAAIGKPADVIAPILARRLRDAGIPVEKLKPVIRRNWGVIWGHEVDAKNAEETWRDYRRLSDKSGCYPLIVGVRDGQLSEEFDEAVELPRECLSRAAKLDGKAILAQRTEECLEGDEQTRVPDFDVDDPSVRDQDRLLSLHGDVGKPESWCIALVETTCPWEVFGYLQYGGWNAYPCAEEHVAIMKHWFETYAAEPVLVTGDCIEMVVARPPGSLKESRELALEQFGYTAGDLIDQGVGHFGTLARELIGRKHWYFWWD